MIKRWNIAASDGALVKSIGGELGIGGLLARALVARGIKSAAAAREFFEGAKIESPLALSGMDEAVKRITAALDAGEKIAVFGDYDVDGITATAMVYSYLYDMGADVRALLPMRDADGYGLSAAALDALGSRGVTLVITVDNGIAACGEIEYAASLNMSVVVCDHHLPPAVLPRADAIVNPILSCDSSSFKSLSGAGVALKLVAALEGCEVEELLPVYGALAAIGTIADIMPLVGENRTIVREGLSQLRECDSAGLCALCAQAGIELSTIDARAVAFGIAPRLNAAGRIGDPHDALRLLITDDEREADELAKKLCALNAERQRIEKDIASSVERIIADDPAVAQEPVIVIDAGNSHSGVIGIVCSRMVEKYGKPTIIISTENGEGKGSGRSLAGFSLYEAVASASDQLVRFGGHELAAGLTVESKKIPAFRAAVSDYCRDRDMPFPAIEIDAEIPVSELTLEAVTELSELEPFGEGNEQPRFLLRGGRVVDIQPMSEGKHSRVKCDFSGVQLSFAVFSIPPEGLCYPVGAVLDVAFAPSIYASNGKRYLSLRALSLMPTGFPEGAFGSIGCYKRYRATGVRGSLSVDREDAARVFRALRAHDYSYSDPSLLISDCRPLSAAQTLACADIFLELGLAELRSCGDAVVIAAVPNKRAELSDSPIFRELCEK